MGLLLSVYRNAELGDCTNGGITSRHSTLCVVNVPGPFNPSDDTPAVVVERGPYLTLRLKPAECVDGKWQPKSGWFMMGGNYAGTSDSRFGEALNDFVHGYRFAGVLPVHDRQE